MTSHVLLSRVLHFITDQDYRHVGIGEPAQTGESTCLTRSVLRPWEVTGQLKVAGEHEHASGPMDKSVTSGIGSPYVFMNLQGKERPLYRR